MATTDKEEVGASEAPHSEGEQKEVKAWLKTLSSTEKWRDEKGQKAGWKRFIDEYKNKWDFLQSQVTIPVVPVNLVYPYVKTEIARMSFRDPWITVNPKRVEDIGGAQIAEQVINYTWQDLKMKQQIKLALLEALLVGHSWIKIGYAAEFGTVESQPKEKKGPGRPKKYKEVETNEYIKSESVFAYHVPYKDIVFDPTATWPATHNARWMAHRVVKPLRAVQQSGIYEHTDELKTSTVTDDPNSNWGEASDSLQESRGKDVKSVVLWEIYDLDHETVTTISPSCEYKLREVPLPDYLSGGFPFVMFSFNPVPGDVYPLSDIAAHEGQIIELTKLLSIELNHLKRWNRQLLMLQGCMTEQQQAAFKEGTDGAIIEVTPTQGSTLSDNVIPVPYAPLQSDIYGVWNQIFQVWQNISGQDAASQGGQAKTQTRTLGELRMQLQGGHARSDEKLDVLEDSIAEVAKKLLTIMQKKYDLPKLARIVGEKTVQEKILKILPNRPSVQPNMPQQPGVLSGMPPAPNPAAGAAYTGDFGFTWNKQDILGEMDVDVLAGSTTPLDREAQLQIMEKMMPFLGALGIGPGSPPAKAFAREFLRLVGVLSLETVMDLADQTPPQPNPKMQEVQAKVQAKAAETKMKLAGKAQEIQGKAKEQQLKLAGLEQELKMKQAKHNLDNHQAIISSVLKQFREPVMNGGPHAL